MPPKTSLPVLVAVLLAACSTSTAGPSAEPVEGDAQISVGLADSRPSADVPPGMDAAPTSPGDSGAGSVPDGDLSRSSSDAAGPDDGVVADGPGNDDTTTSDASTVNDAAHGAADSGDAAWSEQADSADEDLGDAVGAEQDAVVLEPDVSKAADAEDSTSADGWPDAADEPSDTALASPCTWDDDCDDGDPCTVDTCGLDGCVHDPSTAPACVDETCAPPDGFVTIPAGEFFHGRVENYKHHVEGPELYAPELNSLGDFGAGELVELDAYFIMDQPAAVEEYLACVNAAACSHTPFTDEHAGLPLDWGAFAVFDASIDQVGDYCAFVGGRLPTDFEWEKAARGGCEIHDDAATGCGKATPQYPWGFPKDTFKKTFEWGGGTPVSRFYAAGFATHLCELGSWPEYWKASPLYLGDDWCSTQANTPNCLAFINQCSTLYNGLSVSVGEYNLHPLGSFPAAISPYGLTDLYSSQPAEVVAVVDPEVAAAIDTLPQAVDGVGVKNGGCWIQPVSTQGSVFDSIPAGGWAIHHCEPANRTYYNQDPTASWLKIRCAMDPPPGCTP